MSSSENALTAPPERFIFIDDLRGLACLCIVFFHCRYFPPISQILADKLPYFLNQPFRALSCGVPLFFIISGFVIAHSLRENDLKKGSIVNFIARRHIRLDPPYWVAIIFHLAIVPLAYPKIYSPTLATLLANIFYLQDLLHLPIKYDFVGVAWTLCIEVQFYFAFLLLLWIAKRLSHENDGVSPFSPVALGLLLVTGISGLIARSFVIIHHNMLGYWHFFVAGVLCYLVLKKFANQRFLWLYLGVFGALMVGFPKESPVTIDQTRLGLAISILLILLIHFMGRKHEDRDVPTVSHPILQFLSKISYSLYLVHLPIIMLIYVKGFPLTGGKLRYGLCIFLISAVVSVLVATLFYRWIEKPALQWSRRLKSSA